MFSPILYDAQDIFAAVEKLAAEDLAIFRRWGYALDPKTARVRYQVEPDGANIYANVEEVLARGVGDCEDLSAWLIAFLRYNGCRAEPFLLKQNERLYHVMVVVYDEGRWLALDPSKWKGMSYA